MKLKSQKGSITIFVLVALLFFTSFLILMYAASTNKSVAIKEKSDILKGIYEKNTSEESINNFQKKKIAQHNEEIENRKLPSEYQRVEYIESTGTQYIDTGIKLDSNSIGEIDFQITESGSYNIFGSRSSATENSFQAISSNRDGLLAADFQNYQINRLSEAPNFSRNIIKISNKYIEINDNKQIVQNYTEFETPYNSYIFNVSGNHATGYDLAKMKLYTFKLWKNNNLVRNFIPCYRKSDNKPGLYDLANNEFYTNQGTGEFVVGPDVD